MKKTSQHYCKYCKENKAQYDQQDEGNSRNQSHQQKQTCTKDAKVLEVDHIKKTPSVQFCQCESSSDKHVQRKDNYSGPSFKDKVCDQPIFNMSKKKYCLNYFVLPSKFCLVLISRIVKTWRWVVNKNAGIKNLCHLVLVAQ